MACSEEGTCAQNHRNVELVNTHPVSHGLQAKPWPEKSNREEDGPHDRGTRGWARRRSAGGGEWAAVGGVKCRAAAPGQQY